MNIQRIGNLIGYPVYVFGRDWVEKHTASRGKVRHLFTKTLEDSEHAPICGMPVKIANVRCSCLGWMRFGDCKHLKMLRDDWSWIKDGGVVLEYVRAYLPDLDELLPGVAERFERQFAMDAELLGAAPDYIVHINVPLPEGEMPGAEAIVAVHKFADRRQLTIRLVNRGCVEGAEPV